MVSSVCLRENTRECRPVSARIPVVEKRPIYLNKSYQQVYSHPDRSHAVQLCHKYVALIGRADTQIWPRRLRPSDSEQWYEFLTQESCASKGMGKRDTRPRSAPIKNRSFNEPSPVRRVSETIARSTARVSVESCTLAMPAGASSRLRRWPACSGCTDFGVSSVFSRVPARHRCSWYRGGKGAADLPSLGCSILLADGVGTGKGNPLGYPIWEAPNAPPLRSLASKYVAIAP